MESFYDSSDWRINHFIGITAKISTIFALKFGNTLRYVNAPPTTREKNDSITSAQSWHGSGVSNPTGDTTGRNAVLGRADCDVFV